MKVQVNEENSIIIVLRRLFIRSFVIISLIVFISGLQTVWHIVGIVLGLCIVLSFSVLQNYQLNHNKLLLSIILITACLVYLSLLFNSDTTDDILERFSMFLILYCSFSLIGTNFGKNSF